MTDHKPPKILAVDDYPDNLFAVEFALDDVDVEVIRANNGKEALLAATEHDLALILLDVNMPDLSGFEVASLLRSADATQKVPIIFLTGIGNTKEFVFKGYESGAVDYMVKPVDFEILRSKVQVFLDLYSQRQALANEVREKEAAQALLEQRNGDLLDFALLAAHDLKSPLTTILGFAGHLNDDVSDAGKDLNELRQSLCEDSEFILTRSLRLRDLIDNLLDYARAGACITDPEDVDLNLVMRQVCEMLESSVEEAEAQIKVADLPQVAGHVTAVTQLMLNLLANAIKYRGESAPNITVDSVVEGDEVVITVADDGIGIDPAYHERVFTPLKRLHGHSQFEGSGLGLAACRKIAERHGGAIWLQSEEGAGARFHVRLPLAGCLKPSDADEGAPTLDVDVWAATANHARAGVEGGPDDPSAT